MKFSIVTPCWNAQAFIGDTVRSVAQQSILDDPNVFIEYIVVDGNSEDETIAEVKRSWVPHPRSSLQIVSEPDTGMYDALVKGFRLSSGDTLSYLNAGDYYSRHCLSVVKLCREEFGAGWLTGMRVTYNAEGVVTSARVPWAYRSELMRAGHYGVRGRGRFMQQESTFWSKEVMASVDLTRLEQFKLAGDLFLWTEMSRSYQVDVVSAHLGGFRYHGDHLSDNLSGYIREAQSFLAKPMPTGYVRGALHEVLGWIPVPFRQYLPGRHSVIWWDPEIARWRRV